MGTWKCNVCGKNIHYSDGYVERDGLQAVRMISIRRHYKQKHSGKFKGMIRKAIKTRKARRKSAFL